MRFCTIIQACFRHLRKYPVLLQGFWGVMRNNLPRLAAYATIGMGMDPAAVNLGKNEEQRS